MTTLSLSNAEDLISGRIPDLSILEAREEKDADSMEPLVGELKETADVVVSQAHRQQRITMTFNDLPQDEGATLVADGVSEDLIRQFHYTDATVSLGFAPGKDGKQVYAISILLKNQDAAEELQQKMPHWAVNNG
jgi:hypothetical protein